MHIGVTIGGYAAAAILFLLWRGAEKDVLAEIQACNVDELQQTIDDQQREFAEAQRAHDTALVNERRLRTDAENARQALSDAARELETQVAGQKDRITVLEFEASIDEIPTYADCSIVYIPSSVLFAEDCHADSDGDSHDYRVCVGPGGLNPLDPTFTNITVGDGHKFWTDDRARLGRCNAQLEAIAALGDDDGE